MIIFLRLICAALCFAALSVGVLHGQAILPNQPYLEPRLAAYFEHLFLTIANIDDKPSDLQKRRDTTVRHHALNTQEATALQIATQAFQIGLNPLRQRVNVIVVGRRSLTVSDKAQLAIIIQERKSLVQVVTLEFLKALSPAAKARFEYVARFARP